AGPLVLSFAPHAPLPSCLAAWAEHRNCFSFHCIEWANYLSLRVCVLLYGSSESVCAGRPTLRLFVFPSLFYLCCGWVH
ncbi:trans-sialidase, putative, partial [Trypanosoma cruzi marinkellei]